jgi:hypothetical protein
MTLLCQEDAVEGKATHARAETTIREQIDCRDEKFIASLKQKKGAVTAFLQPVGIAYHELLDLRLRESQTTNCHAEATEHFLKGAVSGHPIDLHRSFSGRRARHIATPMLEIGIKVAEEVRRPGKRFLTIGRFEHQWLLPGNELETVIHGILPFSSHGLEIIASVSLTVEQPFHAFEQF